MKSVRSSPRLRAKELQSRRQPEPGCSNSTFNMLLRPRKLTNTKQRSCNPLIQHNRSQKSSSKNQCQNQNKQQRQRKSATKRTALKTEPQAQTQQVPATLQSSTASTTESPSSPTPSFTTTFNYSTPTDYLLDIAHVQNLKNQLKKATTKFDRACKQLILLDQHMSDLQNSYTNSLENDRKTFKIVYRMQLATLEGTHNAYIEYIERQVEKIKKLKQIIFSDNNEEMTGLHHSTGNLESRDRDRAVNS